jgi:hypothetical protein
MAALTPQTAAHEFWIRNKYMLPTLALSGPPEKLPLADGYCLFCLKIFSTGSR